MDQPPFGYPQHGSSSQSSSQDILMQNDPGPSSSSSPGTSIGPRRRKPSSDMVSQRAFSIAASDGPEDSQFEVENGSKSAKKKKAVRACVHCQKAHLTCDDSRPCQRCIKRGLAETCTEGHRKKAKYLLDEEELEAIQKQSKQGKSAGKQKGKDAASLQPARISTNGSNDLDSFMDLSFDHPYPFGSQTANLEYSMLSAILGNPGSDTQSDGVSSPMQAGSSNPSQGANQLPPWPSNLATSSQLPFQGTTSVPQRNQLTPGPSPDGVYSQPQPPALPPEQHQSQNYHQHAPSLLGPNRDLSALGSSTQPSTSYLRTMAPPSPPHSNGTPDNHMDSPMMTSPSATAPGDYGMHDASTSTSMPSNSTGRVATGTYQGGSSGWKSAGDSIYDTVTAGYDYTQGYHFLMRYLSERFDKNDILRVVRALAIFRPSLIALQMPMTEQDEIFVEKALQRSLLELEKLIAYSGTPTAIWRRTGEICVVGLEFSMLTGWSKEELVGTRKFIYELFENQSTVEYWENFASHAFENSSQSVYSHCVILKPSGDPVACSFCFTIRRNMFDLPDLIIGQWLPLF